MKRSLTVVAIAIAICAVGGGIFYYDLNKQFVETVSGRYFIDGDFISRFSLAYKKDQTYFDRLGIVSVSDTGFTYSPPASDISISVQQRGQDSFLIGCSKKDAEAKPRVLSYKEANEFFDQVAFPDLEKRSETKKQIYDRVFKIVGHPGY